MQMTDKLAPEQHKKVGDRTVTFLLVEDDEIDKMAIRRALTELKITNPVVYADDGAHALDILRGIDRDAPLPKPYIVISDLNMPRMDGFEFLKALRADATLRNTIVFVLTTSTDQQDKMKAYEHNVAGYISKSQPADSLVEALTMIDRYWRIVELPN
ncbi:response regulator [Hyphococcus sp.]|uniref:response regulator n=1 Tax=Hyphococcus sp. TaxID=2038636 RepID=UPI003CCBA58C